MITESSGGLEIKGADDVILALVESLREVYDKTGTDMPKALHDVVYQLECRLEEKGLITF